MTESTKLLLDVLDEAPLPVDARIRIERRIAAHDALVSALRRVLTNGAQLTYAERCEADEALRQAHGRVAA